MPSMGAELPPDDEDILDEQDIADIRESLEQIRRGEVIDWRELSAPWRHWLDMKSCGLDPRDATAEDE